MKLEQFILTQGLFISCWVGNGLTCMRWCCNGVWTFSHIHCTSDVKVTNYIGCLSTSGSNFTCVFWCVWSTQDAALPTFLISLQRPSKLHLICDSVQLAVNATNCSQPVLSRVNEVFLTMALQPRTYLHHIFNFWTVNRLSTSYNQYCLLVHIRRYKGSFCWCAVSHSTV